MAAPRLLCRVGGLTARRGISGQTLLCCCSGGFSGPSGSPSAGAATGATIGFPLDLLLALDSRPRLCNKYLARGLDRLRLPGRESAALPDTVARITATGEVAPQQRLFAQVEALSGPPATERCWTPGARTCYRCGPTRTPQLTSPSDPGQQSKRAKRLRTPGRTTAGQLDGAGRARPTAWAVTVGG